LNAGSTLQLYAEVLEETATNRTVTWSIIEGVAANVNSTTGLVTGLKAGTVKVQALATDGSNEKDDITLTVIQVAGAGPDVGGMQTYCYPGLVGCWTITNSKLGTATATTFSGHSAGERGYYYVWANAASACPSEWHVPTNAEWSALKDYINGIQATTAEKNQWLATITLAGGNDSNGWSNWGKYGSYWVGDTTSGRQVVSPTGFADIKISPFRYSVRCMKD
jgi:uncharacterized protein (TIGR02145 family)